MENLIVDTAEALWLSCLSVPEDYLPRGVFADFLEEAGHAELALLLRSPVGWMMVEAEACEEGSNLVERTRGLDPAEMNAVYRLAAKEAVLDFFTGNFADLFDSEEMSSVIAETNATDWGVVDYDAELKEFDTSTCRVVLRFTAQGDPEPDRMLTANTLRGTAIAVVDLQGAIRFEHVTADLEEDPEVE